MEIDIKETIYVSQHYSGRRWQVSGAGYKINDQPIDTLLSALQEQGITIEEHLSQKVQGYVFKNGREEVEVPLRTQFPDSNPSSPESYILRSSEDLELKISNFQEPTEQSEFATGHEYGTAGIECQISYTPSSLEDIDLKIMDKIKVALNKTYNNLARSLGTN